MTFPTIAATNTSVEADNTTSHTVSLPSGISAGHLLLVFFACDASPIIDWTGTGFTPILNTDYSQISLSVGYKIAVGGETTISISTSTGQESSHASYRITGHGASTHPPSCGTCQKANVSNPNPPEYNPGWGAYDILWIALEGNDDDDDVVAYPTNYYEGQLSVPSSTGSGTCHVGVAGRFRNIASENPPSFTLSGSEQAIACCVAVSPADIPVEETQVIITSTL